MLRCKPMDMEARAMYAFGLALLNLMRRQPLRRLLQHLTLQLRHAAELC
jgi:hypothetical protein